MKAARCRIRLAVAVLVAALPIRTIHLALPAAAVTGEPQRLRRRIVRSIPIGPGPPFDQMTKCVMDRYREELHPFMTGKIGLR